MTITKLHRDVIFNRISEITQQQPETVAVDDVKQQFQNWALCCLAPLNRKIDRRFRYLIDRFFSIHRIQKLKYLMSFFERKRHLPPSRRGRLVFSWP